MKWRRWIHGLWAMWLLVGCVVTPATGPNVPQDTPVMTTPVARLPETEATQPTPEVPPPAQEVRVPIKTLKVGTQWPSERGPLFALITGPEGWRTFLRQHRSQPELWPEIDWNSYVVVVAVMGQKRTGGYRIAVRQVRVRGDVVIARVEEEAPAPGEMVIQVLTTPYYLGLLARDMLPSGPFTVHFLAPSGRWSVQVPSLTSDGVYVATPTGPITDKTTE